MSRGLNREKTLSKKFHREGVPLLVSPGLLRSFGVGQIDLAKFVKRAGEWQINILEVKSSLAPNRKQWTRLRNSAEFLAKIFNCSITLDFDTHEKLF